jgi:tRNA threonylcarbamoyl adenosine modification protein YeaZ
VQTVLIDTAGPVVGIATFADGRVVASASVRLAGGAEAWLGDRLAELLPALPALDRVAVVVGPGAFTGIRVGVAAALGLALSRGVPVVAVSSLALRAALAPGEPRVLALLDARKGRVYGGWFDTRGEVPVALGPERDVRLDEMTDAPVGIAVGEGAVVFATEVAAAGHRLLRDAARSPVDAGATLVEVLAAGPAETVCLRYLREPDAQLPRV